MGRVKHERTEKQLPVLNHLKCVNGREDSECSNGEEVCSDFSSSLNSLDSGDWRYCLRLFILASSCILGWTGTVEMDGSLMN
jgi:hypothetical protein